MDIPQPPPDEEGKNIIDRLAVFVARNGQDFETMTKQKQRDNPRFRFLFGGEYYNYYMYRVTSEQAILKHHAMRQQQQQHLGVQTGNQQGGLQPNFPQLQQPNFPQVPPLPQQEQGQPPGQNPHIGFQSHAHVLQQRFASSQQQIHPGPGPLRPGNMQPHSFQGSAQNSYGEYQRESDGMTGYGQGPRGPPQIIQQRFSSSQQGPPANMNPNFQASQGDYGQQRPTQGVSPGFAPRPQIPQQMLQQRFGSSQIPPIARLAQPQPPQPKAPVPAINVEVLTTQKNGLEEKVKESEKNLAAQQQVLLDQQKIRVEEALNEMQDAEIKLLAEELKVDISEFDRVLEPIMESCTKESIANGKSWIFTHTSTKRHYHLMTLHLLRKTLSDSMTFLERLHIIYLINDVLHHCMRKGAEDLQLALEAAVTPMFCYAKVKELGNSENTAKLDKLFSLWESKSNYVSKEAVEKLRNYDQTWTAYKNDLVNRNATLVTQVASEIQRTYECYQNQHQMFTQHVMQNVKQLEQQIQQGILQRQQQQQQIQQQQFQQHQVPRIPEENFQQGSQFAPPEQDYSSNDPNVSIPDLSRPPPGFPPPSEKELIPALPYYELPAGLMVPLVKLDDDNYKPLEPKTIRLPPPCAPTEKLLQAVEAFYGPPSHDNPRDSEGWERLGLYEYYKGKHLARKQKEDDIREGRREKSRSPTPIRRDSPQRGRSPPRRRYQSKSPTVTRRRRSRSISPSQARSRRRRRSRSRSPPRRRRSATPPSFAAIGLGMERKLDESNKGHQLLKKMGWGGTGLGASEQGIEAPISSGEVRDKRDLYKGVGVSVNDPFDNYRKSKAQLFIDRMRARTGDDPRERERP